jgi:hypothetical protein
MKYIILTLPFVFPSYLFTIDGSGTVIGHANYSGMDCLELSEAS